MKKALPVLLLLFAIIFGSCNNNTNIVLKNKNVAFTFEEGTYSLIGLCDLKTHKEHIFSDSTGGELWQLSFAKGEQHITTSSILSQPGKKTLSKNKKEGKTLSMLWEDMGVPELSGIKVEVVVNLPENAGIANWHINVINDSEEWGLWEVSFPKVSGFPKASK